MVRSKSSIQSATFVVKMVKSEEDKWIGNVSYVTKKKKFNISSEDELLDLMRNVLEEENIIMDKKED